MIKSIYLYISIYISAEKEKQWLDVLNFSNQSVTKIVKHRITSQSFAKI